MTLFSLNPYVELPAHLFGWLWGGVLCLALVLLLKRWKHYHKKMNLKLWALFVFLTVLTPLTSLYLGIRLPSLGAMPLTEAAQQPMGYTLMFGAALPWFLAAGFLGPISASFLAVMSGIIIGVWDTHTIFTPLEYALVALCLSAALRQRYRTWAYHFLRSPFIAGVATCVAYPILFVVNRFFYSLTGFSSIEVYRSLEYALSHVSSAAISFGVSLLLAAMIAQIIATFFSQTWGHDAPLSPAPFEQSIEVWFFYSLLPFLLILIAFWDGGIWYLVTNNIQQNLLGRLESSAQIISENLTNYFNEGNNLIEGFADDDRFYLTPLVPGKDSSIPILPDEAALKSILQEKAEANPFFDQLILLNKSGTISASFIRQKSSAEPNLFDEERIGVNVLLNSTDKVDKSAPFIIPVVANEKSGQVYISFIAPIVDNEGTLRGILICRSNMTTNPLLKPVIALFGSLSDVNGYGALIDSNGRMVIHPNQRYIFQVHQLPQSDAENSLVVGKGADGKNYYVYWRFVNSQMPWKIIFAVPQRYVQTDSVRIILFFMLMLVLGAMLSLFVIRQGLRKIVVSLHTFAAQTEQISQGEFNTHETLDVISTLGEDNELGQLKRSFENMRRRLKERLDELNQLLFVSQKVAATLEIREAMLPILEAILTSGVDIARVVFQETFDVDEEYSYTESERLGVGNSNEDYSFLDNSLIQLLQEKDYVILTNLSRISILNVSAPQHRELKFPAMVIAFALRHKGKFYGMLWVGYLKAKQVSEEDEEFRFMKTLISLAAVAAANTKLFHNAEVGRQRLEAILSSSPDPVFVTDQKNRLLFINAAAIQALKDPKLPPGSLSNRTPKTGESVVDVIKHDKLVEFLTQPVDNVRSAEIRLPDRRIYVGTVTSIKTGQEKIGRVCVLKDITSYKELDSLKSEFVSTVSHDLRSPLTIIQGYLSMLDVVGSLNEYQIEYVKKIGMNIEEMLKMINEILDLDRIETSRGVQYEKIAAMEIINAVAKDFHILAAQKQIELSTEGNLEQEDFHFWADGILMRQALHNLVDNAIKFTSVNGKVKIAVEQQNDEIVFSVNDNGIGIAPIDQARLFDKFYKVERVNYSREEDKVSESSRLQTWKPSVGLGLAIVKSIAERHQGRVWVESRLGKGSTFYLAIPIHPQSE